MTIKKAKKSKTDLLGDIERGFVVSRGSKLEKFDAYYYWCKENGRIAVEVKIHGKRAVCKIDTFPPDCRDHPFRFSSDQLDDLQALCIKHNSQKGSRLADIFSMLKFTTEDALAFAADVAEWLVTVKIN